MEPRYDRRLAIDGGTTCLARISSNPCAGGWWNLAVPKVQAQRLVQEVADHREDLKQAARLEGLPEADAESRANALLGDPLTLAEHLMVMQRRSSWWGRHFIIGFCLLPLLTVPLLWALLLSLEVALEFALSYGLYGKKQLQVLVDNPASFQHFVMAFNCTDCVAIALVTLLFCWLARRSAVSLTWTMIACGICSLYALFVWGQITPHSFFMGIYWPAHRMGWIRAAIPLSIAGVIYACRRRTKPEFDKPVTA